MSFFAKHIASHHLATLLCSCTRYKIFFELGLKQIPEEEISGNWWTFKIKLPSNLEIVWDLVKQTNIWLTDHKCDLELDVWNEIDRLFCSLVTCLGLPSQRSLLLSDEINFLKDINSHPDYLNNWKVYSDYVRDGGQDRGEILADVLSEKPVKVNRNFKIPVRAKKRYCNVDILLMREILESI